MGQRSFIIKIIIGSILIGIAVAANYCQLCRNHVACRPKRGFGAQCGKYRRVVPLNAALQKKILQIHDGLRSLVASGLVRGYPPAKRMGHMRWDSELARIAAINARQCYVHYDKCRKTVQFPYAGQNVGIDREIGRYRATNQSIYRITLKWFRQFELANAEIMKSYRIPKDRRKAYFNFANIVHDRQTRVGCAAVRFKKRQNYYFYLVCNYSMRVLPKRKVYVPGTPYTGCVAGRSFDYPSLCHKNERIKSVPYPVARYKSDVNSYVNPVNPLSYFGIPSMTNRLQPPSNGFVSPLNNFQSPRPANQYEVANLRGNQRRQPARKKNQRNGGRKIIRQKNRRNPRRTNRRNPRQTNRRNPRQNRRTNQKSKITRNGRSSIRNTRKITTRKNKTEIQSQPNQMFPNPFSFLFG